jgi:hypothetical protein
MGAECLELLDEAVGSPERRVVRPVRTAAAELVVDDDTAVRPCEALERLQVQAPCARASVQ